MNPFYRVKRWAKLGRWQMRRRAAARRWGIAPLASSPAVLGNAMPKSGSHLIIQVLQGLTRIGPFVNPGFPPVNRSEDNRVLPPAEVLVNIQRMRPGDIGYGYVHACEPYLSALCQPGRATVFVYRDPRDLIVSHVFYAAELHPDHGMHRYYTQVLKSMEDRINAAIRGVAEPGSQLSAVVDKFANYLGWLDQPEVLSLRFEELILERQSALRRLLAYLGERGLRLQLPEAQAIAALELAIQPNRSGTFRKGQPGNWREHFTAANRRLFKQVTGDLLVRLGYERDDQW
jgi:hypothetical protein